MGFLGNWPRYQALQQATFLFHGVTIALLGDCDAFRFTCLELGLVSSAPVCRTLVPGLFIKQAWCSPLHLVEYPIYVFLELLPDVIDRAFLRRAYSIEIQKSVFCYLISF